MRKKFFLNNNYKNTLEKGNSFLKYKKNKYSQNGEDGIIEKIFEIMNIREGNFIEFGAWDGKHLSNTYKLFLENWSGIFIEADSEKYKHLQKNFQKENRITCINSMVGFDNHNNLDKIIEDCDHLNKEFDFISIDVDGLDYFIFKHINIYLPKVICIEINAGHSPLYDQEIPVNIAKDNIGQSMKIICDLASEKNYFPLCYNGNLFLIKEEFRDLFKNYIKDLESIYIDFLKYHTKEGLRHLDKTFVKNKRYNNFYFENKILEKFINNLSC